VLPLGVDAVYQMRQASMPQAISKVISDADIGGPLAALKIEWEYLWVWRARFCRLE
jgi:hypothetical protein